MNKTIKKLTVDLKIKRNPLLSKCSKIGIVCPFCQKELDYEDWMSCFNCKYCSREIPLSEMKTITYVIMVTDFNGFLCPECNYLYKILTKSFFLENDAFRCLECKKVVRKSEITDLIYVSYYTTEEVTRL